MSAIDSQKVPAWKRLGLKLKQPAAAGIEAPNGTSSIGSVGHPSSISAQSSPKRKFAPPTSQLNPTHGNKRPRRDESPKPKKVTFGDTPTKRDIAGASDNSSSKKTPVAAKKESKAKKKGPTKQPPPQPIPDLKPALEYLRLWKTSRESWKFNKNHQSSLIKYIFDGPDAIPSSDVDAFYEYIRDIKGFVRHRLRETAMEVKAQDESDGYASFPEGTTDVDEKEAAYDSILAGILRRRQAGKRKFFSELEYLSDTDDDQVIVRRLVKRMRAELVLDELSDSEESTAGASTSSSKTVTASDNNNTTTTDEDKQITVNGATTRRRRKLRVNVDSSSSESESESDSDSSSSSSDDSDSEEEERPDEDETSSSSSSSSSEGESDSDSDESDED